jgi:hypothetical protein
MESVVPTSSFSPIFENHLDTLDETLFDLMVHLAGWKKGVE